MFFFQKTAKIDKFKKGTFYIFLSKTVKIDKFDKGIPMLFYQKTAKISKWGLAKLSKKQGGSSGGGGLSGTNTPDGMHKNGSNRN